MSYRLFLDDERFPVENDWIIIRNYNDFVWIISTRGIPYEISFDHDLGENKTGYDCAKYLMDKMFEDFDREICVIPPQYYVHSQNPVGAENIRAYEVSNKCL
jgi:hypothetical protein